MKKKIFYLLVVIMIVVGITGCGNKEEKNKLKASVILKANEATGYTCEVNGIDRSSLK